MSRSYDVLAQREASRRRDNVVLRTATVRAVDGATGALTITLAGTDIPDVPHLATVGGYTVGASCAVLQAGSELLVLGRVS